jgi:hypothetical protein
MVVAVTLATPRLYLQTPAMLIGLLYYVRPRLGSPIDAIRDRALRTARPQAAAPAP